MKRIIVSIAVIFISTLSFGQLSYEIELGLNVSTIEKYWDGNQVIITAGPTRRALGNKIGFLGNYKLKNSNSFDAGFQIRQFSANNYREYIWPELTVTNLKAWYIGIPLSYNQKIISDKIYLSFGVTLDYLLYAKQNLEVDFNREFELSDRFNYTGSLGLLFKINESEKISILFTSQLKSFTPSNVPVFQVGNRVFYKTEIFNSIDLNYRITLSSIKQFIRNEK